ncbi:unnamed protein product [Chrysodeixis includens]|uniref:Uncharacterized protein n=1 Tax=Chrysodeixis includens TaxID=689277 RepID=A0A9N8PWI1_CHRIL|nr:unnamed protein product [Chrysodeixis includens]
MIVGGLVNVTGIETELSGVLIYLAVSVYNVRVLSPPDHFRGRRARRLLAAPPASRPRAARHTRGSRARHASRNGLYTSASSFPVVCEVAAGRNARECREVRGLRMRRGVESGRGSDLALIIETKLLRYGVFRTR